MGKKVHELAKELYITSDYLERKLKEIGIAVENHRSELNEQEIEAVCSHAGIIRNNENNSIYHVGNLNGAKKTIHTIIRKNELIIDTASNVSANDSKKDNIDNRCGNVETKKMNPRIIRSTMLGDATKGSITYYNSSHMERISNEKNGFFKKVKFYIRSLFKL